MIYFTADFGNDSYPEIFTPLSSRDASVEDGQATKAVAEKRCLQKEISLSEALKYAPL